MTKIIISSDLQIGELTTWKCNVLDIFLFPRLTTYDIRLLLLFFEEV